jgi:GTPase SAR1 family protein
MDSWKITLLGDTTVGKTTLTILFTGSQYNNYFPDSETGTYGPGSSSSIDQSYRKLQVVDDKMCLVEVIDDDIGQIELDSLADEFAPRREQLIRDGDGCILVYSIDSRLKFRSSISTSTTNR